VLGFNLARLFSLRRILGRLSAPGFDLFYQLGMHGGRELSELMLMPLLTGYFSLNGDVANQVVFTVRDWFQMDLHPLRLSPFDIIHQTGLHRLPIPDGLV